MDCNPPGSSVYEIFPARIGVVAISFCRGSSWSWNWNHVSRIGRWIFSLPWFLLVVFAIVCFWKFFVFLATVLLIIFFLCVTRKKKKIIVYTEIWRDYFESPCTCYLGISMMAQQVKNPSAIQETQVQSLVWKDPLEEENGNPLQYSGLKIPMDRGAWQATVSGVTKSNTAGQLTHACVYLLHSLRKGNGI